MPLTDEVPVRRREDRRGAATARRRDQILDAALTAFSESGYAATSLRDVAARAGLSHTGLLHHFPDKTALLEAVLDAQVDRAAREFPFVPTDGERFVRALVAATARDVREPRLLRLWIVLATEALAPGHPAHGYFVRWHAQAQGFLITALEDLRSRGRYRGPVDPAMAAVHIMTLRDGAGAQWLLEPGRFDLTEVIRSHLRLYVDVPL